MAGQNAVPNFAADKLRRLRDAAQLTQEELAERAGVPRLSVVQWERGWRVPIVSRLAALAKALDVSPAELTTAGEGIGAETLAELRRNAGLTQTEAGAKAGLGRSSYSALERGEVVTLDPAVAQQLAGTFTVTVDQIRTAHAAAVATHHSRRS
ncbi:MAG TPA: helix-turn-helix transcriptional regulator [Mycobacteriales bacterium]|nr:helix-turn-helix transcriptional regulator [Mycobacteriales bacterium]